MKVVKADRTTRQAIKWPPTDRDVATKKIEEAE